MAKKSRFAGLVAPPGRRGIYRAHAIKREVIQSRECTVPYFTVLRGERFGWVHPVGRASGRCASPCPGRPEWRPSGRSAIGEPNTGVSQVKHKARVRDLPQVGTARACLNDDARPVQPIVGYIGPVELDGAAGASGPLIR